MDSATKSSPSDRKAKIRARMEKGRRVVRPESEIPDEPAVKEDVVSADRGLDDEGAVDEEGDVVGAALKPPSIDSEGRGVEGSLTEVVPSESVTSEKTIVSMICIYDVTEEG